jgi:hypothetical protein
VAPLMGRVNGHLHLAASTDAGGRPMRPGTMHLAGSTDAGRRPMREVPRSPGRGNWIWLAGAALAIAALAGLALPYLAGRPLLVPGASRLNRPGGGNGPGGASSRGGPRQPGRWARPGAPGSSPLAAGSRREWVTGDGTLAAGPGTAVAAVAVPGQPGGTVHGCALGPARAGGRYASLPPQRFAASAACGGYVTVAGPWGQVRAEVAGLCQGCAISMIKLSRAAFDRVAIPGPGPAVVRYWLDVNPPLPGPIVLRAGVTRSGRRTVQVVNTGNPLRSVAAAAVRPGHTLHPGRGHWLRLRRGRHDWWILPVALPAARYWLQVTDDQGHRVTIPRILLSAGNVVRTRSWMYGPPPAGSAPYRHLVP